LVSEEILVSNSGDIIMLRTGSLAYGQDFLAAQMRAEGGFLALEKRNGVYPVESVRTAKAVVGENPNDGEEARALNYLGRTNRLAVAVCVHCQWEYYSDGERANIAHALDAAAIGITPAEFLTDRMRARFGKVSWKTVDGCVDTRRFCPSTRAERVQFRSRFGLAQDDKFVLFAGRLETAKGTKILEDVCACPRREFAILVQYPAWDNVREKAALFRSYMDICDRLSKFPDVHFLPDRDPRSSPRPVRFADIFVSASLSEVQPLVLLEALASGVPFVGTDSTPAYAELQDRFGDSPTLSSAIETIDLPYGMCQGAVPRSTELSDSASRAIANELVEAINRKAIPDDSVRAAVSSEFVDRGFTVRDRHEKFRQVLEDDRPQDAFSCSAA
jgi:glycosyltransferase involved in cell wall biosynthesis